MSVRIERYVQATASLAENCHPVLSSIYQSRGIQSAEELQYELSGLLPFHQLHDIEKAASLIADAIMAQQRILIVGDFDADGATSTALGIRALRQFGAHEACYLVPNRFEYGYGLTPEIVEVARHMQPQLLITVDNGISSIAGVKAGYPAPSFAAAPVYFGLLILGKPNGKPMHAHPPTTRDGMLK